MSTTVERKRGYTVERTRKMPKGRKQDRIGRKGKRGRRKRDSPLHPRQTQFMRPGYFNCARCVYQGVCKVKDEIKCPLKKTTTSKAQ